MGPPLKDPIFVDNKKAQFLQVYYDPVLDNFEAAVAHGKKLFNIVDKNITVIALPAPIRTLDKRKGVNKTKELTNNPKIIKKEREKKPMLENLILLLKDLIAGLKDLTTTIMQNASGIPLGGGDSAPEKEQSIPAPSTVLGGPGPIPAAPITGFPTPDLPVLGPTSPDLPVSGPSPAVPVPGLTETETPTETESRPMHIPTFANDEAKRTWLMEILAKKGISIPKGTRTATLEKKYLQIKAGEVTDDPKADAPSPTPDPIKADTVEDTDLFGLEDIGSGTEDRVFTREEITNKLQDYLNASSDAADKNQRREEIKKAFNGVGASNISTLAEKHFAALYKIFDKPSQ